MSVAPQRPRAAGPLPDELAGTFQAASTDAVRRGPSPRIPVPAFSLVAAAATVDRGARPEHMRVTIPFAGAPPTLLVDEINRRLRATMVDSGDLQRLRAVQLAVHTREAVVVLSAAGAAHAVEHWLGDGRLFDAVRAAVESAAAQA